MITDFTTVGVRIRTDDLLTHTPNRVIAGEDLRDGHFVFLGENGRFTLAVNQDQRPTHCVIKSGEMRHTPDEIALIGLVLAGEPVMAFTGGPGKVRLPVASTVTNGQDLTISNGYAVAFEEDVYYDGAYIVGKALEDADGTPTNLAWIDCLITLPATFQPRA